MNRGVRIQEFENLRVHLWKTVRASKSIGRGRNGVERGRGLNGVKKGRGRLGQRVSMKNELGQRMQQTKSES